MKNIGIIANIGKDKDLKYARQLEECIRKRGGQAIVSACCDNGREVENDDDVIRSSDMIICLGGDGTFLRAARKTFNRGIPLLGINLGSLGFLTEVERHDLDSAVEHIMENRYRIENRMLLEADIFCEDRLIATEAALNDIVISRGALSRILHLKTYINNAFVDSFPGDGVIISSPTGSTAYSLSAGGPIVEPDIDLIIITPICPHILYSRSFITAGDREVMVEIDENYYHDAMVTVDGQKGFALKANDRVVIRRAKASVKLVRIHERNFFGILRKKIYDRGEGLRRDEIQQTRKNT